MTKGLKTSSNIKLKLYRDSLLKRDNQNVRNKYTKYRNLYQRLCRKSKMAYYKEKCIECRNNTKKLWTIINQVIGKTNNKMDTIEAIKVDNILKHGPKEITNSLAKYFSNVGQMFSSKITKPNNPIDYYLNKIPRQQNSLFLSPTTPNEIMRLIEKLPNKRSSGHDGISNILLNELKVELSIILCDIFNESMQEGVFPEMMKLADVVPLYKSKTREEPTNYRPISLLLTLSKLLEKIIYKRTYEFLENNHSLFTSQYGFRSKHSCENAISELLSTILKNKETKKHTMAVFLDLSKAFDSLEHEVLYRKLELYGIRGQSLDWYKSYLQNRSMRVKCRVGSTGQIEYSEYYKLDYGTPQGSCLGPLLFLIFSNDLHLVLEHCMGILFADDTTVYKGSTSLRYLKWCLEDDLGKLSDWFRANKLTLNIGKSQCVLFPATKP